MSIATITCFPVLLNTQTAAARLVDAASRCGFDVRVESGRFCVDAKSMLGVLSLDITKPCFVVSDCDLSALRSAVADMVCEAPCR